LVVPAWAQNAGEAVAWNAIRTSGSTDQLKAFLDTYPTGQFAPEARQKYSLAANTMLAPQVQSIDLEIPLDARRVGRTLGPLRVVKLNIVVQPDGKARDVELAETSGYDGYDREAMRAARSAIYLPGLDHGMAVEARMDYQVSFGLLCNRAAGNTTCDNGRFPVTCSATVCARLLR
jgi:TonB family protein